MNNYIFFNKFLPNMGAKGKPILLLCCLILIYLLDNIPSDFSMVYRNIIKPVLFLGLAGVVWLLPRVQPKARMKLHGSINLWALIFAIVNIAILFFLGLYGGFGKSPYNQSFTGIVRNLFSVVATLTGQEMVRSYIVNSLCKNRTEKFLVFVPVALILTINSYSLTRISDMKSLEASVQFIARYAAPEFMQNLFAAYLSFLGGWVPSLIYMGMLSAFNWFSPILPEGQWIIFAAVGILCPIFSMITLQNIYAKEAGLLRKHSENKESPVAWIITCIVSISIIWFVVGVFSIYPSVIATGSMEPEIKPGDVILLKKIKSTHEINNLKVGDIIQFRRNNIFISHRIVSLIDEDDGICYRTRGDNNSVEDVDTVKPQDIKGKVVYVLPKIGWPTLIIKGKNQINPEAVVY